MLELDNLHGGAVQRERHRSRNRIRWLEAKETEPIGTVPCLIGQLHVRWRPSANDQGCRQGPNPVDSNGCSRVARPHALDARWATTVFDRDEFNRQTFLRNDDLAAWSERDCVGRRTPAGGRCLRISGAGGHDAQEVEHQRSKSEAQGEWVHLKR